MPEKIKITLKKSYIGRPEKHRKILKTLGLKRLNKTRIFNNTPQIQGMILKVGHLLEVEKLTE